MVLTRRKRKQISYYEADSDQDDMDMDEVDHAMEETDQAERGNGEASKVRTIRSKTPTKAPFEMIPEELLPNILSYLDNIREVYHLSNMNKSLRNSISPALVVRTTVFSGNPYAGTLDGLMEELANRSIQVPSTLRLLRLVTAKCCERGKECFCYNLENERSGPLVANTIRPYGVAICSPCLHALSANDCPSYLSLDGISTHASWSRVLCYPQVEQATGDPVGPMVLFRDIKQIQYSYSGQMKQTEVLETTIQSATAQAIGPDDEQRLLQFCGSHAEAQSQYKEHVEAKRRLKLNLQKEIAAKRAARKLEIARPVFQKLQSHFSGYRFESIILCRDGYNSKGKCNFHYWPSDVALGPLAAAPSTATQKKILDAVAKAKMFYNQLEEYGFLGTNFPRKLHLWLNTKEDIPLYEQALVRYCAEHKTSESMVLTLRNSFESAFSRERLLKSALDAGDRAKIILSRLSVQECREAFSNEVVRATTSRSSQQKRQQLATHIFGRTNARWGSGSYIQMHVFRQHFDECKTEYSNVLRKILRYKKHPDTIAWVEETHASGNFSQSLTPRDAIDTLYKGDFGSFNSDSSFTDWRRYHTSLVLTAFVSDHDD